MPKKEKAPAVKKSNWLLIYAGLLLLIIAGILYLDTQEKKANTLPPISTLSPVAETPPPLTLYTDEEISAFLALKEPVVFYFFSTQKCRICPTQSNSLQIRLGDYNIRVVNVTLEDNNEILQLFEITELPSVVLYQEKELYRKKLLEYENPEEVVSVIKETLGIS